MKSALRCSVIWCTGLATFCVLLLSQSVIAQEVQKIKMKDGKVAVEGSLTDDDAKDEVRNHPCKIYVIELKKGTAYQIDMVSKDIDSYLRLEDAAKKQLAEDDDSGGFPNARIIFACKKDGAYRIIATTFNGQTGPFELTVKEAKAAKAAKAEVTEMKLKDGAAEVNGELTKDDAKDTVRKQSLCKIFAVKLEKGKTYQIDMVSTMFDAYLRLEDANGKELAKDDDSGGDLNARILFDCPKEGVYRIIATTFIGGSGEFTLSVKRQ